MTFSLKQNFLAFFSAATLLIFCAGALSAQSTAVQLLQQTAALIQTGKFSDAEPLIRRAVSIAPDNPDAQNLLGIVLDALGKPSEAERAYRTAVRLNPKAVSPLANLGVLLAKTNRRTEAAQTFESVLRIKPDHPQSVINLGLLYAKIQNYSKAVEFLKKAADFQPDSADVKLNLGIALFQLKKPDEAENHLTSAMALAPENAESFYYLGLIAFDRGNDENAGAYFQKTVELNPEHISANFMLGELYARYKRYAEAKSFYEKALRIDDSNPVNFIRLGGMHIYLNEFGAALSVFQKAAEKFPKVPEIYYFSAIAARSIGDYEMVKSSLNKALILKPDYPDALALSGSIDLDRGNFVNAEKNLRRAIAVSSRNFNANYDLGRLFIKTNRHADALPFLEVTVKLKPENPDIHYQLFLVFSRLKQKEAADRELEIYNRLNTALKEKNSNQK